MAVSLVVAKPNLKFLGKLLKNWAIYRVTLAIDGAFLLRTVAITSGISESIGTLNANGNLDITVLLLMIPAVLGFLAGSPSEAIAVIVSILAGVLTFTTKTVALLYIAAYFGYLGCFNARELLRL